MKKIIFSLSLVVISYMGYSQAQYDSLHKEVYSIYLKENPNIYNGQSVIFEIMYHESEYFSEFFTEDKVLKIDTIYLEPEIRYSKKELKDAQNGGVPLRQRKFTLDSLKTNIYKNKLYDECKVGTPVTDVKDKRFIIKKYNDGYIFLEDSLGEVFWFDFNKISSKVKLILEGYEKKAEMLANPKLIPLSKKHEGEILYAELPQLDNKTHSTFLAYTTGDNPKLVPLVGKLKVVGSRCYGDDILEHILICENGEEVFISKKSKDLTDEDVRVFKDVKIRFKRTAMLADLVESSVWEEQKTHLKKLENIRIQEQEYLAKRPDILKEKYGEEIAKLILERKVRIGMTTDACWESWGTPKDINTTVTQYSRTEQWVYGAGSYLYFTNGKLTAIQN